ncbi:hypothetical protein DV515_00013620 [Chloebia gouldiae]|uniref:Uncharacterized protein n=1 Tax=Chloebia gouldiae TaxID=44316 RepID=A0A3L8S0I3_CHLGU|nr:hypothetical protein DV515_00013620 [Chloebia gouldiae]
METTCHGELGKDTGRQVEEPPVSNHCFGAQSVTDYPWLSMQTFAGSRQDYIKTNQVSGSLQRPRGLLLNIRQEHPTCSEQSKC